jgi:Leucine-rich repeat (LRR) protein
MSALKNFGTVVCALFLLGQCQESAAAQNSSAVEEENNYPFIKSSGRIAPENVAGIRIKKGGITLFGFDNTYSSELSPNNLDFSDINFFRQYPKLMSVELDELSFSENMLENLGKFLPPELKVFIMRSCVVKKEHYELLADLITTHKSLESVSLFCPDLSGTESETVLSALKGCANVKFLDIAFGELTSQGIESLASLISSSAKILSGLSLGWKKITDAKESSYEKITNEIRKITNLRKLGFSVMSLSERDLGYIVNVIGDLPELRYLKLFFDGIKEHKSVKLFENGEALQRSLVKLSKLEEFDVSSVDFPAEVFQMITKSVESMPALKTLNISDNTLDEKSAQTLSESIKKTDSIVTLLANYCRIDAKVFSALCRSLSGVSLQHLYFRGNKIKGGAKSLPIASMPEVSVVDFSDNEMNYDDAMGFIQSTKGHVKLQIVNFKGNSGIEKLSGLARTEKNDQLVEWKIKNEMGSVAFFGL